MLFDSTSLDRAKLRRNRQERYLENKSGAYSFVLGAWAMVLTGERTLSDTSGARQHCPRARQTAADNYVYGLSAALK
jgi:hypothetical protein